MVTSQALLTTCYYRCTIRPLPDGRTQISESISLRGPLSAVIGPKMRGRIARGFEPTLKALAARAERLEQRRGSQAVDEIGFAEMAPLGTSEGDA